MWNNIKRPLIRGLIITVTIPTIIILSLRWINPTHSAFILQHNLTVYLKDQPHYAVHSWTDWEDISPHMSVAVIAAEDQRFPTHFGIDFKELGHALSANSNQLRGASTITQQTVKNLFLWPGRSYVRKIFEAGLAVLMELCLSKQRILEIYLNIAQTGKSDYGITAAANYFNKSPAKLNRYEAARIAAILPNPSKYSVVNSSAYILQRQSWIMKQARQLGGPKILIQLD